MSVTTAAHAARPVLVHSEATLVLETANSVYALTIGMSQSRLTCVMGTLEGDVVNANVVNLSNAMLEGWSWATGAHVEGQNRQEADWHAQRHFGDRRLYIGLSGQSSVTTSTVEVARWVISPQEVLAPVRSVSRKFAVATYDGKPVTRAMCCHCDQVVDLTQRGGVSLSRANGDSRWGYEAMHAACLDQINREIVASINQD